jgi:hypothetical protein
MKLFSSTRLGIPTVVCGGLLMAFAIVVPRMKADTWDKKTIITVNEPIQVENTYLEPGSYVLKLLDSSSDRHIVQIYNRDQNHLINTVLAIPNYRLQPTGNTRFTFYETPPGTARAMRAWFYPGDNYGQEFRYPKELRQIAFVSQPTLVTRPPEPPPPPIVTKQEEPAPAPAPEQAVVEQPKREEPQELAQATPPPPPAATPAPAPEPAPAAAPAEQPTELPKTATPFPLIGLGGLLSLLGAGLLRKGSA